jgi:hypothetical protein
VLKAERFFAHSTTALRKRDALYRLQQQEMGDSPAGLRESAVAFHPLAAAVRFR